MLQKVILECLAAGDFTAACFLETFSSSLAGFQLGHGLFFELTQSSILGSNLDKAQ